WEWCDFNLNVSNFQIFPSSCSQVWNEINDTCGLLTPDDIQSHDNTLTSSSGIGQLYGGSARAAIRGGGYLNSSTTSGIYSLGLNNGQGFSHSSTGFRCVYRP
ncbi:MAG: hypothetical protein VX341_01845, partial [Bdellovibrionota bacterium]|nr:hypothetical protein [Bdellovibrionota bacterium]